MTDNPNKMLRSYERTRAAAFVKRYEDDLRKAMRTNPLHANAEVAERVAERLGKIRLEIMGSVKAYIPPLPKDADGFSADEIEKAMEFLDEEN